jgi:hypothetical protein
MSDERAYNDEAAALAERMLQAVTEVALGHPQARVALAITCVCSALVRTCARPGEEAAALRTAATHMVERAQAADRKTLS